MLVSSRTRSLFCVCYDDEYVCVVIHTYGRKAAFVDFFFSSFFFNFIHYSRLHTHTPDKPNSWWLKTFLIFENRSELVQFFVFVLNEKRTHTQKENFLFRKHKQTHKKEGNWISRCVQWLSARPWMNPYTRMSNDVCAPWTKSTTTHTN